MRVAKYIKSLKNQKIFSLVYKDNMSAPPLSPQIQQQKQLFFDGLKKGFQFGVEWYTLETALNRLRKKIVKFEEDLVDPLIPRLGQQLDGLCRQIKIEYEEFDELMDDDNGVNRETEFESILYNFTVFKIKLNSIGKMHGARIKKAKRRQRQQQQQQQH